MVREKYSRSGEFRRTLRDSQSHNRDHDPHGRVEQLQRRPGHRVGHGLRLRSPIEAHLPGDLATEQEGAGGEPGRRQPLQEVPGEVAFDQSALCTFPRNVPHQYPAHRGGQPGLPTQYAADQFLQETESGGDYRGDPAVPESTVLFQGGAEN